MNLKINKFALVSISFILFILLLSSCIDTSQPKQRKDLKEINDSLYKAKTKQDSLPLLKRYAKLSIKYDLGAKWDYAEIMKISEQLNDTASFNSAYKQLKKDGGYLKDTIFLFTTFKNNFISYPVEVYYLLNKNLFFGQANVLASYYDQNINQILKKINKPTIFAEFHLSLSHVYIKWKNYTHAKKHLDTVKIYLNDLPDNRKIAYFNNKAFISYKHKQFDKAKYFSKNALSVVEPSDTLTHCNLLLNISQIFLDLTEPDSAVVYCQKALTLCNLPEKKAQIYYLLGRAYLFKKNTQLSETFLQQTITKTENKDLKYLCYNELIKLSIKKNKDKTLIYTDLAQKYKDTLIIESTTNNYIMLYRDFQLQVAEEKAITQAYIISDQIRKYDLYKNSVIVLFITIIIVLFVIFLIIKIRLTNRIARKEKLLNAQKNKFFSIISHDLKNKIIFMPQNISELRTKIKSVEKKEIEDELIKIENQSQETVLLLNNLFQWSLYQLNRIDYSPQKINLQEIVKQSINFYAQEIKNENISVCNSINSELNVFADRYMIIFIIRNLLNNAIKYASADKIKFSAEVINKNIQVKASDNGIGITEKDQNKLFKIEEKTNSIGKHKNKGSGLGLILCKEYIEKNKGKIWVKSIINKGSKFYFTVLKN